MADAGRDKRGRHVRDTRNLNYGHFGTAKFDEASHQWHFLRGGYVSSIEEGEDPVTPFRLVHEKALHSGPQTSSMEGSWGLQVTQSTLRKTLQNRIPEAAGLSPELLSLNDSKASEDSALQHCSDDLLAFGNARIPGGRGSRSHLLAFAAFPAGVYGETVRMVGLEPVHLAGQGDIDTFNAWTIPHGSDSVFGDWVQSAERVLQITCCASHFRNQLLVRKSGGTSILRPVVKTRSIPAAVSSNTFSNEIPSSTTYLEANHIVTIPSSRTGGHPQTNASFSPKNPNLVAIIDSKGHWSVWKIQGKSHGSTRVTFQAFLVFQKLQTETYLPALSSRQQSQYDGWHRISWLLDSEGIPDRLLVSSRASSTIIDSNGNQEDTIDMGLIPFSGGGLLLDVKQGVRYPQCIYVLSTSRLQILTTSTENGSDAAGAVSPATLFSWNHYRDENDSALRMAIVELTNDISVVIYSSTSATAHVYRVSLSGTSMESSYDPAEFPLPKALYGRFNSVTDLALLPLDSSSHEPSSVKELHSLVKFVAITWEGQLLEAVYQHGESGSAVPTHGVDSSFYLHLYNGGKQRFRSGRFVEEDDLEDFIVDDHAKSEPEQPGGIDPILMSGKVTTPASSGTTRGWANLLEYPHLQSSGLPRPTFTESIEKIFPSFNNRQFLHHPITTLSAVMGSPQSLDVDNDSQEVANWIEELRQSEGIDIQTMVAYPEPTLGTGEAISFVGLYDAYLNAYMVSLSSEFTDRSRVNREKLVRQTATDAFLGSFAVRDFTKAPVNGESDPNSAKIQQEEMSASQVRPLLSQNRDQIKDELCPRLRCYAEFEREQPPLLLSSRASFSDILGHLPDSIDEDPSAYSYVDVNKDLQTSRNGRLEQSLEAGERRRLRKQATQREKNLEKQAKFSQEMQLQRSLLPSVTTRRLGANLPGREIRSSQPPAPNSSQTNQQGSPALNMTQPERGAFGAREHLRKAKSSVKDKGQGKGKRKEGF